MTHDDAAHHEHTRAYYDDFAARYEAARRPNDPTGYHALLDDLEVEFTMRFGRGKDVLEAGCGTGLVLAHLAEQARHAEGFDLSPGMLEKARERGLTVKEGSLVDIPFPDASFDVVCSFKVLAHVHRIERALAEMARVTRPSGVVVAEFYNPWSFRGLAKRLGPAGSISEGRNESEVFTRFDSPLRVRSLVPPGCRIVATRGIRIATPMAAALRVPLVGRALVRAERLLADTPARVFGGFYLVAFQKAG